MAFRIRGLRGEQPKAGDRWQGYGSLQFAAADVEFRAGRQ
jgi:hypothetical protein